MNGIHDSDDLWSALNNNQPQSFTVDSVKDIVAEVPGENDEFSWWWILELSSGKFVLLSGWCDYTGWDCQSGIDEIGTYDSALLAANDAPEQEDYSERAIRKNLVGQLTGEFPKFTYWSN